jgi:hypothetical protein
MQTEVARVRQEIIDAFREVPVPVARRLIKPHTGDPQGAGELRRALAGKPWDSLSAGFLNEYWAAFCYLSAEAYRYYVPALLVASLDRLSAQDKIVHSTVYGLVPSTRALYYEGNDADFDYHISLFTDRQYAAVCAFLGLFLDEFPERPDGYPFRFLAARSLRWGWNKIDTPAQQKRRQLDEELHHFVYPTHADASVAALIDTIAAAFADTPYPGDNNLCDSAMGDEPAEYAMEFRGLDWRTMHPKFLSYNHASLSFLTGEGFRYFLPAYLICDLHEYPSGANPVFHLTHGFYKEAPEDKAELYRFIEEQDIYSALPAHLREIVQEMGPMKEILESHREDDTDWRAYSIERFAGFSRPERLAIISYLEHVASLDERETERDEITQALENYWRPSVA